MAEKIVYQTKDIAITTARVSIRGTTYQLCNISDLKIIQKRKGYSISTVLLGGLLLLGSLANFSQAGWQGILLGTGLIVLSSRIGFYEYYLHFNTNSGATDAYKGKKELAITLKQKIEEAMAG